MATKGVLHDFLIVGEFDEVKLVDYLVSNLHNANKWLFDNRSALIKAFGIDRTIGSNAIKEQLFDHFIWRLSEFEMGLFRSKKFELIARIEKAGQLAKSASLFPDFDEYRSWCQSQKEQDLLRKKYLHGSSKERQKPKGGLGGIF